MAPHSQYLIHTYTHIQYIDSLIVTHAHSRSHSFALTCIIVLPCEIPGAVKMESRVFGEAGGENYPQWALNCQGPD